MSLSLKEKGRPLSYVTGDYLYHADYTLGEPSVFLILEGEIEVVRRYNPIQKETFRFGKGELVGLLEVYTGSSRVTDAIARGDVRALGFSRAEVERNMAHDLKLGIMAIRSLSRMLRQANDRIKTLN
ncbi:MAG: cyclic nucleotide-binding domain-containing protein [Leptospirales bacterium]|nr:cyclic nucleotide-binding domain-containing protein [Leptospirales bacterium]